MLDIANNVYLYGFSAFWRTIGGLIYHC